ncbi:unnamed product [Ostreococcus tauri]|uniref:Unnamed product n=1 Tax=Ostreococcus tauri TaxID=70448 RepID=A0A090MCL1_OSTTA|nr:unnamed product [Ostreococcus tauri]CEG01435.1 unnamed product [Ostreococcus tauri]|eukprot:XP_022840954.1 unnamed product [Ostreococcus tauri]
MDADGSVRAVIRALCARGQRGGDAGWTNDGARAVTDDIREDDRDGRWPGATTTTTRAREGGEVDDVDACLTESALDAELDEIERAMARGGGGAATAAAAAARGREDGRRTRERSSAPGEAPEMWSARFVDVLASTRPPIDAEETSLGTVGSGLGESRRLATEIPVVGERERSNAIDERIHAIIQRVDGVRAAVAEVRRALARETSKRGFGD